MSKIKSDVSQNDLASEEVMSPEELDEGAENLPVIDHETHFTPEFRTELDHAIKAMIDKLCPAGMIIAAADEYEDIVGRLNLRAVVANSKYNPEFHFILDNVKYRFDDPKQKPIKKGEREAELNRRLINRDQVIFRTRLIWVKQGIEGWLRQHVTRHCPDKMHGATFESFETLLDVAPIEFDVLRSRGVNFEENMIDQLDLHRALGDKPFDIEQAQALARTAVSLFTRKGDVRVKQMLDQLSEEQRAQLMFYLNMVA